MIGYAVALIAALAVLRLVLGGRPDHSVRIPRSPIKFFGPRSDGPLVECVHSTEGLCPLCLFSKEIHDGLLVVDHEAGQGQNDR